MAFWTFIWTYPKSSKIATFWGLNGDGCKLNGIYSGVLSIVTDFAMRFATLVIFSSSPSVACFDTVSYTHLTLPTILRV